MSRFRERKNLTSQSLYQERLAKVAQRISSLNIDALLLTHLPNIKYLTGFTGSNAQLLITPAATYFFSDSRYEEQAFDEVLNAKIFITNKHSLTEEIHRRKILRSKQRLGFEKDQIAFAHYQLAVQTFKGVKFTGFSNLIEQDRLVKSETEIELIKKAVSITDTVFEELLTIIKPGISELDVAAEISYRQKKHGAQADAFEPIVLTGKRTSLIHGKPDNYKIKKSDILLLDFGCIYHGYHSDMTRTIFVGRVSLRLRIIYMFVKNAQEKALASARDGVHAKKVDHTARLVFADAGIKKFFNHSTGHGLGLELHEQPRISTKSDQVLCSGNVITVEPGVYIPGVGGVRIEDDVVIRNDDCEILNRSPKELIAL